MRSPCFGKWPLSGAGLFAAIGLAASLSSCSDPDRTLGSEPVPSRTLKSIEANRVNAWSMKSAGGKQDKAFTVSWTAPNEVRMPLKFWDGLPHVQGRINGKTLWLIPDTGSQVSVLEAQSAVQSGVRAIPGMQVTLGGEVGDESAVVGLPETVCIDRWAWSGMPWIIRSNRSEVPESALLTRKRVLFDILGVGVLRAMCSYVTFDFPKEEIVFGFHTDFQPPGAARASSQMIQFRDGLPVVETHGMGCNWLSILDTGSSKSAEINPQIAASLGVKAVFLSGDASYVALGRNLDKKKTVPQQTTIPSLDFLGKTWPRVVASLGSGDPKLGTALLRRYRLTLDFKRSQAWLESPDDVRR